MRRIVFPLCGALAVLAAPEADASTYNIDLTVGGNHADSGPFFQFAGPCYCYSSSAFLSSVYTVMPGDHMNFGSVSISAFAGGPTPDNYQYYDMYGFTPYWVQGLPTVSFNPDPYGFSYSFSSYPPLDSPSTIFADLIYDVPDGAHRVQVGWVGDYSYAAPAVPPVPEPSTWAMLLIGFAGTGYAAYRRKRKMTLQSVGMASHSA